MYHISVEDANACTAIEYQSDWNRFPFHLADNALPVIKVQKALRRPPPRWWGGVFKKYGKEAKTFSFFLTGKIKQKTVKVMEDVPEPHGHMHVGLSTLI